MSTRNLTLSLDAMGGDNAPGMVVDGISLALARMPHVDFLLFGDEKQLIPLLDKTPSVREVCQVRHTEDTVSNDEKAGVALRSPSRTIRTQRRHNKPDEDGVPAELRSAACPGLVAPPRAAGRALDFHAGLCYQRSVRQRSLMERPPCPN